MAKSPKASSLVGTHFGIDKIIYLDPALIAAVYEQETGFLPPTRLSRKEQTSSKIGPNFLNLGAGTEETREYTMSPTQMLRAVWNCIAAFPNPKFRMPFGG